MRTLIVFLLVFCWVSSSWGYFLTVFDPKGQGYALKGQEIQFFVLRTEPFQGIVYDLRAPKGKVFRPDKKTEPLAFVRVMFKDFSTGKKRFAWKVKYVPTLAGDYYFLFITQPTLMPAIGEVWQEIVKVPLHVEEEKGWGQILEQKFEIVPMTRPYGLSVGQIFRGQILFEGKPAPKVFVQVVRFNGVYLSPDKLPKDKFGKRDTPRMYFSLYTDENGEFSIGFPQDGWWLITAKIPYGKHMIGNTSYPLFLRTSFWLYVGKPFKLPEKAPVLTPEPPSPQE
ncbi:DUF4198 domain-containing protein [Thermodesulfatator indicus]